MHACPKLYIIVGLITYYIVLIMVYMTKELLETANIIYILGTSLLRSVSRKTIGVTINHIFCPCFLGTLVVILKKKNKNFIRQHSFSTIMHLTWLNFWRKNK